MKILIVEDETFSALFLKRVIQNLGYLPVAAAESGEKALEEIENSDVDLVLMDINLIGDRDGIDTAKEMKEYYEVPIIFITAYSDSDTRRRAMQIQPEAYLTKPLETSELREAIGDIAS